MTTRARGFTTPELLTVLAIVAIMLSIAVPSFRTFISNYRVTSAVNDMLQGVTATKAEALKEGKRVFMIPKTSSGTLSTSTGTWVNGWSILSVTDTNKDGAISAAEAAAGTVVYTHGPLPSTTTTTDQAGSNIGFTSGTNTYVAFDGTGYPRKMDGTILSGGIRITDTMSASPNVRTLCLARLGRPRVVQGIDACSDN